MDALLDTHGFDAFIEALVEMSGKPRQEVLLDQAGAVLDLCVQRSPGPSSLGPALKKKVELRITKKGRYIGDSGTVVSAAENRVPRPIPYSTLQTLTGTRGGRAGREWYIGMSRNGKRLIIPGERMLGNEKFHRRQGMRDALFGQLEQQVKPALDAVGSLKASWVHIARKIGAPLRKVPAYLRKRAGGRYDDGQLSRVHVGSVEQFIEIVNTNPLLIGRYNGAGILQGAIDTRLKAFAGDIRRDVFADITVRAQRYPGIFTS